MKRLLSFFSYLLHPLFIPVFTVLFYFLCGGRYFQYQDMYVVFIQIIILTILLPMAIYYFLMTFGKVTSIMLSDKAERRIPLAIYAVLLLVLIKKCITIGRFPELYFFFFASLISTVIALILVFMKRKASLHMIGIVSLTVFAIGISIHSQVRMNEIIAFLVVCIGLVASSRLEMKAHTYTELALGALTGLLPQLVLWYFWV